MQTLQIDFAPNTWQTDVLKNIKKARFFVISAGRQSGKTFLAVFMIAMKALSTPNIICFWVAPTYTPAKMAFRRVIQFLVNKGIRSFKENRSENYVEFPNKSRIYFKSGDREEGLRGETVNFMVIDEMGLLKRDVWEYALRGTVTATQGKVMFIGTPKGKNLFYELYLKGQDPEEKEYLSFQFSSNQSEFFPDEEWESVQRLPERIFQQEYQAMFLDDGGEVFRNIRGCIRGALEPPNLHDKSYYAGVDLAKSVDYSVIIILDQTGHMVHFERFKDIAWAVQRDRIINTISKYNAFTKVDSTGVGDPVTEDLIQAGINVSGFKFSNTSKRQIIEKLAMAVERQEISFPDIPELINEMNIFTFETLPSGMIRYSAPEGLHDDCFVKGTMILTDKGQVPIERIKIGDRVMTRKGFQPVVMTRNKYKKVIKNIGLTGTPDHPVITVHGEKDLTEVNAIDKLYIWNEKLSSIEEKSIIDTLNQKEDSCEYIIGNMISGKGHQLHSIGRFGLIIMEKFQKGILCITRMTTHLIMQLKILRLCQEGYMLLSTCPQKKEENNPVKTVKRIFINCLRVVRDGGKPKKQKSFCEKMHTVLCFMMNRKKLFVNHVMKNFIIRVKLVGNSVLNFVQAVITGKRKVYNLQIANQPEYFANNILVHNCVIAFALAYDAHGGFRGDEIFIEGESRYTTEMDW